MEITLPERNPMSSVVKSDLINHGYILGTSNSNCAFPVVFVPGEDFDRKVPALQRPDPRTYQSKIDPLTLVFGRKSKFPEGDLGKLTVISYAGYRDHDRHHYWNVECECGTKKIIKRTALTRSGNPVRSCGCDSVEKTRMVLWKGCGNLGLTYFGHVEYNAKKRDIPFLITIQYAWALFVHQKERCAYTNLPLNLGYHCGPNRTCKINTASLDRIDSSIGYVFGNVQWVHKNINRMKWELSHDEFVRMCTLVAIYN